MDSIFVISLFIFSMDMNEAVRGKNKMCSTSTISGKSVPCEIDSNGSVCLVCPIKKTEMCSSWWLEGERVTRYTNCRNYCDNNTQHIVIEIGCHRTNYSLRVYRIDWHKKLSFTCRDCLETNSSFSFGVRLITRVTTSLEVTMDNPQDQDIWSVQYGKSETFYCMIFGAVSPFNLTWFINEVENRTHVFQEESNQLQNDSLQEESNQLQNGSFNLSFVIPARLSTISCKIIGPYIVSNSANISIRGVNTENKADDTTPRNGILALYICVPCLFIASILTSLVLYFKAKNHHWQLKLDERRKSKELVNVDSLNTENDGNVCPYSDITNVDQEATTKTVTSLSAANICLVTRLKSTGSFEYWSATFRNESSTEEKCFAKTLSNLATMRDATTFQELALKLKALEKSNFIVLLLSISIEELPYTICYEYMECGSLRDFMLKRYQQARTSRMSLSVGKQDILPANIKSQIQELLTFASMIAEAMKFLCSQKFSHPALSLKKVLLSEYCECKLYDIYPTELAMTKVNELKKKHYPPIAWMAPETVFLQEYLSMSDVWSFAVLLWELFSLGEVPFARRTKDEVEQKLREGFVLPQPLSCPGAIYGIMLSCWNNAVRKRPSFEDLLCKLINMMEKYDQREQRLPSIHEDPKDPYFVLEPDQTNDYTYK